MWVAILSYIANVQALNVNTSKGGLSELESLLLAIGDVIVSDCAVRRFTAVHGYTVLTRQSLLILCCSRIEGPSGKQGKVSLSA